MDTDFDLLASSHLTKLMIFRAAYIAAQERLRIQRKGRANVAELAVIITRGGRRIPQWMRNLRAGEINQKYPLHELSEHEIHKYFDAVCWQLRIHRIVPGTKNLLFATYLTGQVCATAASLSMFAGIAKSTAHKWLHRCAEIDLLAEFETEHEIFYVQPSLMQLVLVGTTEPKHIFRYEFDDDLSELRRRSRNWLQTSRLLQRLEKDLRTYGG